LAALLVDQSGCDVVAQVSGGAELLAEIATYEPDVILWDLGWDPVPAPTTQLDLSDIPIPVVALLTEEAQAAETWLAGAQGLLPREASAEDLTSALKAVGQGLVVLDPTLAPSLLPNRDQGQEALVEALTPRELEVLQLLSEGLSNKIIADRLDISQHTVKFHVNAILGKLDAQSRTEAVVRATRLGLIIL
jgi:DNA-binding NarL/FixJ family response regulator